jgi:hypothetical protein
VISLDFRFIQKETRHYSVQISSIAEFSALPVQQTLLVDDALKKREDPNEAQVKKLRALLPFIIMPQKVSLISSLMSRQAAWFKRLVDCQA